MGLNKRISAFDFVKFIAIFMVLWGHIIQYLLPGICYENTVYLEQLPNFYEQFYYRMLIGLAGSLFIILTADEICKRYRDRNLIILFSSFGRETLAIYLFQYIIIETLLWRWLKSENYNAAFFSIILAPLLSTAVLNFAF